jgi:hypothetical protein
MTRSPQVLIYLLYFPVFELPLPILWNFLQHVKSCRPFESAFCLLMRLHCRLPKTPLKKGNCDTLYLTEFVPETGREAVRLILAIPSTKK